MCLYSYPGLYLAQIIPGTCVWGESLLQNQGSRDCFNSEDRVLKVHYNH